MVWEWAGWGGGGPASQGWGRRRAARRRRTRGRPAEGVASVQRAQVHRSTRPGRLTRWRTRPAHQGRSGACLNRAPAYGRVAPIGYASPGPSLPVGSPGPTSDNPPVHAEGTTPRSQFPGIPDGTVAVIAAAMAQWQAAAGEIGCPAASAPTVPRPAAPRVTGIAQAWPAASGRSMHRLAVFSIRPLGGSRLASGVGAPGIAGRETPRPVSGSPVL